MKFFLFLLLALVTPFAARAADPCSIDQRPAATLLLPYFEVDPANPSGLTTLDQQRLGGGGPRQRRRLDGLRGPDPRIPGLSDGVRRPDHQPARHLSRQSAGHRVGSPGPAGRDQPAGGLFAGP